MFKLLDDMSNKSFSLDLLAQEPRINRLYTHLTLCFALDSDERASTTQTFTNACKALSDLLPWSAGEVVYDGTSFRTQLRKESIQLVLKEMVQPTFDDLKMAQFPFSMIHESDYAPCNTVATDDATKAVLPVFMIQATHVRGGLLLTFAGQHGAMDVIGLGQLMYFFSRLCRNDPLTESELEIANAERWTNLSGMGLGSSLRNEGRGSDAPDRSTASPTRSLGDAKPLDDGHGNESKTLTSESRPQQLDEVRTASKIEDSLRTTSDELVWAYFVLTKSSLNALKSKANETVQAGSFASTDDVLTAFVWLSITRARTQISPDRRVSSTTLSRQVDMRRFLSVVPTYPGLMVQETRHNLPVDTILRRSLGSIAIQLRSALDRSSLTRDFHEKLQNLSAGDNSRSKSRDIPPLEVRLSSWSKLRCYELDLGFGKPVCVRRPAFSNGARDGLVYFLPKEPDDSIVVGLCLEDDDLRMLTEDAEFAEFATYIG